MAKDVYLHLSLQYEQAVFILQQVTVCHNKQGCDSCVGSEDQTAWKE